MKKILYMTLLVAVTLTSCSKRNDSSKPTSTPANESEEYTIEGTVTKVIDLVFPSAYATDFSLLEEASAEKCAEAASCAFLVDASAEEKVLDAEPVVAGKFKFKLSKKPLKDAILKVVVKGWDSVTKKPLLQSDLDRELSFNGSELSGKVDVNHETTLVSKTKLKALKNKKEFNAQAQAKFSEHLYSALKNFQETKAETFSRLLDLLKDSRYQSPLEKMIEDLATPGLEASAKVELSKFALNKMKITGSEDLMDLSNDEVNSLLVKATLVHHEYLVKKTAHLANSSYEQLNSDAVFHSGMSFNVFMSTMALSSFNNQLMFATTDEERALINERIVSVQANLNSSNAQHSVILANAPTSCVKYFAYEDINTVLLEMDELKDFIEQRLNPIVREVEFSARTAANPAAVEPNTSVPGLCCASLGENEFHESCSRRQED